ncbi:DNA primase small subunit [Dictyocoela muelleri]|nr:DNA primase small subunit [Dictyocoela muelleri]
MSLEKNQLLQFYKKNYPSNEIFNWLKLDHFREISFTLQNDVYSRYNSFNTHEEFKSKLIKDTPIKIDIGAIYSRPVCKNNPDLVALRKELVFDIDLTDYNRTCCEGKKVCEKCFIIIKAAVHLLNYSLRDEFGFSRIKFIFSGGRGVHCWVSDDIAMNLNILQRIGIVSYYSEVMKAKKFSNEYKNILSNYFSYFEKKPTDLVLFENLFPKLDENVTKDIKHLLKAPFCVHPATKNICVPIDPKNLFISFNDFPTIDNVLDDENILLPYIQYFIKN